MAPLSSSVAALQVTTGAAAKYQDLKLILAHAGAFIPYIASRLAMAISAIPGGLAHAGVSESDVALLKRFYVDTALSSESLHGPCTAPAHKDAGPSPYSVVTDDSALHSSHTQTFHQVPGGHDCTRH